MDINLFIWPPQASYPYYNDHYFCSFPIKSDINLQFVVVEEKAPEQDSSMEKITTMSPKKEESSQQMQSLAKPKIYSENSFIVDEQLAEDECLCEVCCDLMDSNGITLEESMICKHKICIRCWKLHLTSALQQQENQKVCTHTNFCSHS